MNFKVKKTHRGPIFNKDDFKDAQSLSGSFAPLDDGREQYSLQWGGHYPGESFMRALEILNECKDVHCVKDNMKADIKEWRSMPISVVLADQSNIGYVLLSSSPKRPNQYPYVGNFI